MAEENEVARKFDEAPVAGGYFIGTDGTPHDANGEPVKALSESKIVEAQEAAAENAGDPDASTSTSTSTSTAPSRSELEAMDKADLQALADKQGLTVEGSGANGNVLKSDLVDALAQ